MNVKSIKRVADQVKYQGANINAQKMDQIKLQLETMQCYLDQAKCSLSLWGQEHPGFSFYDPIFIELSQLCDEYELAVEELQQALHQELSLDRSGKHLEAEAFDHVKQIKALNPLNRDVDQVKPCRTELGQYQSLKDGSELYKLNPLNDGLDSPENHYNESFNHQELDALNESFDVEVLNGQRSNQLPCPKGDPKYYLNLQQVNWHQLSWFMSNHGVVRLSSKNNLDHDIAVSSTLAFQWADQNWFHYIKSTVLLDAYDHMFFLHDTSNRPRFLSTGFRDDFFVDGTCTAVLAFTQNKICAAFESLILFDLYEPDGSDSKSILRPRTARVALQLMALGTKSQHRPIAISTDLNDVWEVFWIEAPDGEYPFNLIQLKMDKMSRGLAFGFLRHHIRVTAERIKGKEVDGESLKARPKRYKRLYCRPTQNSVSYQDAARYLCPDLIERYKVGYELLMINNRDSPRYPLPDGRSDSVQLNHELGKGDQETPIEC